MRKIKVSIFDLVEVWVERRYGVEKLPEYYDVIVSFLGDMSEGDLDKLYEELEKIWEL